MTEQTNKRGAGEARCATGTMVHRPCPNPADRDGLCGVHARILAEITQPGAPRVDAGRDEGGKMTNETMEVRPERQPSTHWAWHNKPEQGALVFDAALITPEGLPPLSCDFGHHERNLMPEPCEREASICVNGIPLCEVHGAEAEAGLREELYQDASDYFEALDHPHYPSADNRAVLWALRAGALAAISEGSRETDEDPRDVLERAYPLRRELMDTEAREYDYARKWDVSLPEDWYYPYRLLTHKLQRLAYEQGATWIVETLEPSRQSTAVQLAYAIQDAERQNYGFRGAERD